MGLIVKLPDSYLPAYLQDSRFLDSIQLAKLAHAGIVASRDSTQCVAFSNGVVFGCASIRTAGRSVTLRLHLVVERTALRNQICRVATAPSWRN